MEGGVRCPYTGKRDPARSQEVVLPSLPLLFLCQGAAQQFTGVRVAEGLDPYIAVLSSGGRNSSFPLINGTITNRVSSERTVGTVCICVLWMCVCTCVCMHVCIYI